MKVVSSAYKKSMAGLMRDRSYAVIYFGNVDAEAATDGEWESNGAEYWSEFNTVDYRYNYPVTAATLEWNRWSLDGSQRILPGEINDGYVSDRLSGENGTMASAAILTRQFNNVHMFPGMTLTFDSRTEEWPVSVTITFYLNNEMVYSNTAAVTDTTLSMETDVDEADKVQIVFNTLLPYRRPRLEYVLYGIGREYTNDDIVTLTQSNDVDPLSRRLPNERFTFTIWDLEHNYDPDNPQGIYRFVEIKSPVSVKYGYTLPDGAVEWLKEDNYLLDAQPKVSNNQATFSATGLIGSMSDVFYKSRLGRKSFYDMAEEVLLDANLTLTSYGEHPWVIDETLKDMYTTAVLPIDTHMNCLQYIAHACRCCLYTDDDNIIHIEPFGVTVAGIFSGAFSDNGHTPWSEWSSVNTGTNVTNTYATLEWNRWELGTDSMQVILPDGETKAMGYVSSQLGDADGTFSQQPVFTRTFDVKNDLPVVGIAFDSVTGEHPTSIEVRYFDGNTLLDAQSVVVNDENCVVFSELALDCNRIQVRFHSTLPYYRVRVTKVYYKQTDFSLNFETIKHGTQTISKIDKLKSVTVAKSVYTPRESETKLYEATTDEEILHIEFNNIAENLAVILSSGTVQSATAYGRAMDLIVSPGEKIITITGNVIEESSTVKTYSISTSGEIDEEKNPLITDDAMQDALANHVATYLQMRNTYDVEYRGNPELETRDVIGYQTAYTEEFYALVLTDEITFDGALHGKVKVKGLITTVDTEQIRIIAVVSPSGSGMVSGAGNYYNGDVVKLVATPSDDSEWRFSYWMENGEIIATNATLEFVAMANRRLTAVFAAVSRYTVNLFVEPDGGGTVSGDGAYDGGTEITVTATEASGYTFIGWQENGVTVSDSARYTFTVTDDRVLTAVFSSVLYNINISASPESGGTVSGGGQIRENSTAILTATANGGYRFTAWQENGETVSESATYTFTVTGDRTLVAVFKAQYTVTVTVNPAGYGTASGGGTYAAGDTVTLTASENDGYSFVGWSIGGTTVSTDKTYSFTASANVSAVAVFQEHEKELVYYGTAENLSNQRRDLAATSIGDYALFGGGCFGSTRFSKVDAYNTYLTHSLPTELSEGRSGLAATSVGNYALFAGGYGSAYSATVDAYDRSLTRLTPTALSGKKANFAATSVGNYALFGGGYGSAYSKVVTAYDKSLTISTPTALSVARRYLAAASVGNYALFGGGQESASSYSAVVNAYDTSLTRSTPTALSGGGRELAATKVGEYALFGGGYKGSYNATVNAYNTSLTRSSPAYSLSKARSGLAATNIGNYALFAGGDNGSSSSSYLEIVDAYDTSLTRSTPTTLSSGRSSLAATAVGNYALFGGGYNSSVHSANVDVYTVQ